MEEAKKNRTKLITLRLTIAEYELLDNRFKATTCRKLSDYLRKVLLTGKVTILTRNKSLDDFMAEMIELRNQLSAIGNNFNQAVHKLHILDKIPEF
ncbi:MAG: mobilization protein [Chitinophagaceae bacterium]